MTIRDQIVSALKKVFDPEMPVNIYELGLIYAIDVDDSGRAAIRMTLTAPNCPVAGTLPGEVERAVRGVPGITDVKLELTFDPPWSKDRMSEAAKLALGIEDIARIVEIQLRGLRARLADRKMSLELTPAAAEEIARAGFDPVYGARPLKRALQKDVVQPLAVRLLQGEFGDGDTVRVDATPSRELTFSKVDTPITA